MSSNNNNGVIDASNNNDNQAVNKRAALAGQWRTPPMPAYPSGYDPNQLPHPLQQQQQQYVSQQQGGSKTSPPSNAGESDTMMSLPNPTSLPNSSEDYAKALQEAYRKGAEAAARMAQQQQPIPNAASCPNFQTGPHVAPPSSMGISVEEPATYQQQQQQQHQIHPPPTQTSSAIPDPLNSSMPPPPPPSGYPPAPTTNYGTAPPPPPQSQDQQALSYASHSHQQTHPSQQQYSVATHQQHVATSSVSPGPDVGSVPQPSNSATAVKPPPGRSMSMPDMSAYAAKAEEEKRQKRLARNRASARLRRLRKKNLVDAYETEVGILEKTLKQLQAHEWGKDDDHKALLDALGMERGQQAISPEQRTEIIQDILKQQMQQVQLLRQAQVEQECLALVANDEDDEFTRELQEILQLTDAQKADLRESSKGLDKEVQALETVTASLQAMQENEWLLNEGVQKITDQFTSILHKNQQSKFLLWTDANAEAIDQLDHVQVQPLQSAPIFSFGVDTSPGDDDDKQ